MKRRLAACILWLALATPAAAQTNPGFIDGATLCANMPNALCQTNPINPIGLNQAFMNKADYPVNFSTIFSTPNRWTAPQTFTSTSLPLTLNANTAPASPGTLLNGTAVHIIGADGVNPRLVLDAFAIPAALNGRRANGTAAVPLPVTAGSSLFNTNAFGFDGNDYFLGGQYVFVANSTWSPTNRATYWVLTTTPEGTTLPLERIRVHNSGGVSIGNTTDPGQANLNVSGSIATGGTTIGSLPTCTGALTGTRTYVTNGAASPGFLAAVSATGTTVAPVFCNGSAWVYG